MIQGLHNGGLNLFFREKKSKRSKTSLLQLVDTIRPDTGARQRVVVSLGSQFKLPTEHRHTVARLVEERLLGQQNFLLFNLSTSVFLYDVPNTYFEGRAASTPKAEYHGTQKENRTDCPQVVGALVVDGEGFLRRHRMFNGKMTDATSLSRRINDLPKECEDVPMPTLMFDRGGGLRAEYEPARFIQASQSQVRIMLPLTSSCQSDLPHHCSMYRATPTPTRSAFPL